MIRVVSWNIAFGRNIDRAAQEIDANPQLRAPDVLMVQELSPQSVAELADRLGIDYRYAAAGPHPKSGAPFGNAVLSPWPMGEVEMIPLPHTATVFGQPRSSTTTVVDIDGIAVVAHSVHLETALLPIRHRVDQVSSITESAQHSTHPCVIGGDFNTASIRSLRRLDDRLAAAGFTRLTDTSTATFRRFGRKFSLDHLYARGFTLRSVGVEIDTLASDHHPVWATLELSR